MNRVQKTLRREKGVETWWCGHRGKKNSEQMGLELLQGKEKWQYEKKPAALPLAGHDGNINRVMSI